jgi:ABC-2 type transport system permease protein
VTGALWYLLRTSGWNRLRRQAMRLKSPRYAIAFLLGLAYFWFVLIRPGQQGTSTGFAGGNPLIAVIAPAFFILAIGYAWLFGSDRSALTFSPAEVAMLFPAPVPRRALILYKLARSQVAIIVSILIWVIILRGAGGPLSRVLFGISLWAVLSTYTLHRLGVALLRAGLAQHGSGGARRSLAAMLVFAAVTAAVAASLWAARTDLEAAPSVPELLRSITETLRSPPAGIALAPLHLLVAPLSAGSVSEWLRSIGPALLILGLHVWWVLRSDAAFEEAAAEASAKTAKFIEEMKAMRSAGGIPKPSKRKLRRSIPLAPIGAPAVAIVWKNALWLWRSGNVRGTIFAPILALVALIAIGRDGGVTTLVIAGGCVTVALLYVVGGPAALRNDLRADLRQLSLLKTLPLRSRDMVLAQVLGTAIPAAAGQILLVLVGGAALAITPQAARIPSQVLPAVLIGAPAFLLAINAVNFALHNGVAVLFPAWVRLGDTTPGGIESMGQVILMSVGTLLALMLLMLLPLGLGAAIGALLVAVIGSSAVAIVSAAFVTAAALAGEAYLMIVGIAGAYERMEPTQTV